MDRVRSEQMRGAAQVGHFRQVRGGQIEMVWTGEERGQWMYW